MKPEFRKIIDKLKSLYKIPRVTFSPDIKSRMSENEDELDYIEGMMVLLEAHPFLPMDDKYSFGSDLLNYRRAVAYEIIIRQLGYVRSFIANVNALNHIGTGISIRCMLELYAFAKFINETNAKKDLKFLDRLLHGRLFASGDWYDFEQLWEKEHGEPVPREFKDFMKSFIGLPHVSTYLKHLKDKDKGFDYMYAVYSEFVHPTFERPRSDYMLQIGHEAPTVFESKDYYLKVQKEEPPLNLLLKDIGVAAFCLELFWPEAFALDPLLDDRYRKDIIKYMLSKGAVDEEGIDIWIRAGMLPKDIFE